MLNTITKIVNKARKITNAAVATISGAGSRCDYGANVKTIVDIPQALKYQIAESEALYFTDWQAKKVINIPVDDMLREGWEYTGLDEEQKSELQAYSNELGLHTVLFDALRLERLHGGSAIFMGIADGVEDAALPVNVANLTRNSLKFLNVMQRQRITRIEVENDPTKAEYGRPMHYWVGGIRIHRSRLLVFAGSPLLPNRLLTTSSFLFSGTANGGFGFPLLMTIYADLQRATLARQSAAFLIQRASNLIVTTDLQTLEETNEGAVKLAKLNDMTNSLSSHNATILDGGPGLNRSTTIDMLSASFGSVPELVMSFLQVLSAASDIPATKFLSQAPGGLNATGDSDLENYYTKIRGDQNHSLKPILNQFLSILLPSALSTPYDQTAIDIEFNPLWDLSEIEQAQVRQTDTQNIVALVNGGLLSDEEGLEELKSRDVILNKDATVDPINESNDGLDAGDPQVELDKFIDRSASGSNTAG